MDEFEFLRKAFFRLEEAERLDARLAEHIDSLPKKQQFFAFNHSLSIKNFIQDYLQMKIEKARGRG